MGFFLRENNYTEIIKKNEKKVMGRNVNSRRNVRSTGSDLSNDKNVKQIKHKAKYS